MCGIIGYVGNRQAQPLLLDSLSKLEYRGYDSCGLAVGGNSIKVFKNAGRVEELRAASPLLQGTVAIGHTRWATHGSPSSINAHPHVDCNGRIAVVHNGVITNYQTLRQRLIIEGHNFVSETDTEVIPHLIEKHYKGNIEKAVEAALGEIEGSYAIAVLAAKDAKLVVARKGCPLIIGVSDRENFVASDVPALLEYTNSVIYLENGDIGVITADSIKITRDGIEVDRKEEKIFWSIEDVQKGGYEHFMLKEIHEQPRAIRDTIEECLSSNSSPVLGRNIENLSMVACGTSYHAALIGKYVIEELLAIPVAVEIASEFNHRRRQPIPTSTAIVLTQSGETADVLVAMKRLLEVARTIVVITNVPGSTATRIAKQTVYIKAGPEVSVAATKTFTAQLIALYQLILSCPSLNRRICKRLVAELRTMPSAVQQVLNNESEIMDCARILSQYDNAFFIGRGISFPIALEGALKLKEISYIHAEGCAAGELKHGPLALAHKDVPIIAITPQDSTYEAMVTNIKEVKARDAPVIALVDETDGIMEQLADFVIRVPHVTSIFSAVVNAVAVQLLAYYAAKYRGCPIDFPRNLAKSVTVE